MFKNPRYRVFVLQKGDIMKLSLYNIDERIFNYLKQIDYRVTNFNGEKSSRPFVGVLIIIDDIYYLAPLSSPKEKHLNMKNSIDFVKIDNGNLGVINLNNMIPILRQYMIKIDTRIKKTENKDDIKYKMLLNNQLSWINRKANQNKIILRAQKLREKYINGNLPKNIKQRCVNFIELENKIKLFALLI